MTTDYTLLPPNASPLERALEVAMRPAADVLDGVGLVRGAKESLPDGWPLFLVWEYGLEELLPYLSDPRVVLSTGLQWQRIKGTPASVLMALGWLDLPNAVVEQETAAGRHWYEFQVDPGLIPGRQQLENLVGLARLSAPVGTRLARVFHGYDRRRAVYDDVSWSDGSLYSDYSGIYDADLDVRLSFGATVASGAALGDVVTNAAHTDLVSSVSPYDDRSRWDFASWGDGPPILNYPIATTDTLTDTCDAASPQSQATVVVVTRSYTEGELGWSDVPWGARTWAQPLSGPHVDFSVATHSQYLALFT